MKIPELLQIELWSKKTSRKILVVLGSVFGVAVVAFGTLYLVEEQWLTPPERRTGREALVLIDGLQNLGSSGDKDFNVRDKQAQEKVGIAKQAAVTARDEKVANVLDAYLVNVETERSAIQERELMQQRHVQISTSERDFEERLDSSGKQITQFIRAVAHKALD